MLCIFCFVACGGNTDTDTDTSANTDSSQTPDKTIVSYKVTGLDESGNPLGEAVVYFGDKKVFTDENGVATAELPCSEFVIRVEDYSKNEFFIGENVTVTPENNEITVNKTVPAAKIPDVSIVPL